MLSDFLRYSVVDARGQQARLVDLAVDLTTGDYPVVTRLYYHGAEKSPRMLPWGAVGAIDWRARRVAVRDLGEGEPAPRQSLEDDVLLGRDVLDALVLDLHNLRATRANDLQLRETEGRLWLSAADASPWGVVRRLTLGRVRKPSGAGSLYDWKYVEFLRGDPEAARHRRNNGTRVARLPPGEIARLSGALPYLHAAELITMLPDPVAADTLEALTPERQVQVFEELDVEQRRRLLLLMRPDIVADLLGHLEPDEARRWLEGMAAAQRERVIQLLRFPDDTAGGIMTNDLITLPSGLTVGGALRLVREELQAPDFINFIYDLYVVDDQSTPGLQRLLGALPLRDLIVADDARVVDEIMNPYQITLHPLEPGREAALRVIDSELLALPVVASDGLLLGVVTIDAALSLVAPESWRSETPRLFS